MKQRERGRGTSNGCLEAYWFAECVSSQQVCINVLSLELKATKEKKSYSLLGTAGDFFAFIIKLKKKKNSSNFKKNKIKKECRMMKKVLLQQPFLYLSNHQWFVCLQSPIGQWKTIRPDSVLTLQCVKPVMHVTSVQRLMWCKYSQL